MIEVDVHSSLVRGAHRMDPDWPAEKLGKKIEQITGIPPQSQRITVVTPTGEARPLPSGTTLRAANVDAGSTLQVEDVDNTVNIEDDGDVNNRYQLDLKEYERRENTLLDWKRKNGLGRFAPQQQQQSSTNLNKADSPVLVKKGDECMVKLTSGAILRGSVQFVGEVPNIESGTWIGVRLPVAAGRNNGTVRGVKLFDAEENHGVLVRPDKVRPITEDEEEI